MAKKKAKVEEEKYSDEKEDFQSGEEDETSDEKTLHMRTGKDEKDVYSHEGREELIEENEIEDWEEGFAEGAEGVGHEGHCMNCKKMLDEDSTFEAVMNKKKYLFCSEKCLIQFKKKNT